MKTGAVNEIGHLPSNLWVKECVFIYLGHCTTLLGSLQYFEATEIGSLFFCTPSIVQNSKYQKHSVTENGSASVLRRREGDACPH
jgi:hypothetical protein